MTAEHRRLEEARTQGGAVADVGPANVTRRPQVTVPSGAAVTGPALPRSGRRATKLKRYFCLSG